MLLDYTYFITGDLYLPLANKRKCYSDSIGSEAVIETIQQDSLQWYIDKYEIEYLYKLLGCKLAPLFIENMKLEEPDSKWLYLRDLIYKSNGLYKESPAANYVYYWVRRKDASSTEMKGEFVPNVSIANSVQIGRQLCMAWNEMCVKSNRIRCEIFKQWKDYKDLTYRWDVCHFRFIPINNIFNG